MTRTCPTERLNPFSRLWNSSRSCDAVVRTVLILGFLAPSFVAPVAAEPRTERPRESEKIVLLAGEEKPDPKAEKKDELVKVQVALSVDRLPVGKTCQTVILLSVKEGWHIQVNPAAEDYLIPTEVTMKSKSGVKLTNVKYPKGKMWSRTPTETAEPVYSGNLIVMGTLEIPADAKPGVEEELEFAVKYQPCRDDGNCIKDRTATLKGKLIFAGPGEPVRQINQDYFPPPKK